MNRPGDKKMTFPWHLLALDGVGALLVAWGIYRFVGDGSGVVFIVAGFLLMAPFAVYIINQAQGRARSRNNHSGGQ